MLVHFKFLVAFLLSAFMYCLPAQAQTNTATSISWQDLADVTFKDVYIEAEDGWYWHPTFGDIPTNLAGKVVKIKGYMIPVSVSEGFYVLSANPNSSCFFCGAAGPESIVELDFKNKDHRRYIMDERLTFKGVLELNTDDIDHCNYILKNAVEID